MGKITGPEATGDSVQQGAVASTGWSWLTISSSLDGGVGGGLDKSAGIAKTRGDSSQYKAGLSADQ